MLEWNVLIGDFNHEEIKEFNVFDHWRFMEDCQTNAKKNAKDFAKFCDTLHMDLSYYFRGKYEYEIIVSDWPPSGKCDVKYDVYDQVMLNWEFFCNYVWSHAVELRRFGRLQRITRDEVRELVGQIEKEQKNEQA